MANSATPTDAPKLKPIEGGRPEKIEELWRDHLLVNSGGPRSCVANALIALKEAPEWQGRLGYDEMHGGVIVLQPPPWQKEGVFVERFWTDTDDIDLSDWLQHKSIMVRSDVAGQAVESVSRLRSFHPVVEYLKRLVWDGKHRLDTWCSDYLGAVDTNLARTFGAKWMISAVARVYSPGCKADHCLVLEGEQGRGKTTALQVLGGDWYCELTSELGSKDSMVDIRGAWIVELAELAGVRRGDLNRVKAYISRQVDEYRTPYGRRRISQPRQCVYAGSVNAQDWHTDESGARRWWPIWCTEIDVPALKDARDQLWAEACARYMADEPYWLDDDALKIAAEEEAMSRLREDPWDAKIGKFLEYSNETGVPEILNDCLGISSKDQTDLAAQRVGRYLKSHHWERFQKREGATRSWRYKPRPPREPPMPLFHRPQARKEEEQ